MDKQLHETIYYPDASFPYIMYTASEYEMIPPGRGFNDLHWHEDLQFTLVTQGVLVIQVNGIDHELRAGQAIFINKGVLHISTELKQNGRYISFNFPEKLLSFYADSAMEQRYVLPYTNSFLLSYIIKGELSWEVKVLEKLQEIREKFTPDKPWGWEYEVSILTVQLWLTFISNLAMTAEETPRMFKQQQERLQIMLSFIHQRYPEQISLQDIAGTAHLSVSECNRSFKRTIHITAYDYLIKYRIKRSGELLLSTDYSVTEVARRVGFNHVNHYIQSFRKYHDMTPREFRQFSQRHEKRDFD